MLSQPWIHPVVLNTGPLNWESSALTSRPLLHVWLSTYVLVDMFEKAHSSKRQKLNF